MSTIGMSKKMSLAQRIWKARWIYLFLIPGILVLTIFRYGSMYGILLAFKKYKADLDFRVYEALITFNLEERLSCLK